MLNALLSIFFWAVSILLTIFLWLACLFFLIVTFPFDKQRKILHSQCFWWCDLLIGLNPKWSLEIKGSENINYNETYVIVSNHQSLADIIVMYKTRMQFKWVAKKSLFKLPFVGWCLRMTRHIALERGNPSSIKKIYREASAWLQEGMSVFFFPEGTRSDTDDMNVFQNGPFKLAIKEKKKILPIVIDGTRDAIPKGSWVFERNVFGTLTVLPTIDTSGLNPGDFASLRDAVRNNIEKVLRK